jgi:hypothetical protein
MAQKITATYDVILKVGEANFHCDRRLLAEYSPYFQAMFGNNFIEREKTTIEIKARRFCDVFNLSKNRPHLSQTLTEMC